MELKLSDPVIVGKVIGQFGSQGRLKVKSYCRPVEEIFDYACWFLADEESIRALEATAAAGTISYRETARRWVLLDGSVSGKNLVAHLGDCESSTVSSDLVGCTIAVDRSQLKVLPKGEYYWTDLYGLQVENLQGISLGQVVDVLETGANDVLVVESGEDVADSEIVESEDSLNSISQRLLPWIDSVVIEIDLDKSLMRVDWPEDWDE